MIEFSSLKNGLIFYMVLYSAGKLDTNSILPKIYSCQTTEQVRSIAKRPENIFV